MSPQDLPYVMSLAIKSHTFINGSYTVYDSNKIKFLWLPILNSPCSPHCIGKWNCLTVVSRIDVPTRVVVSKLIHNIICSNFPSQRYMQYQPGSCQHNHTSTTKLDKDVIRHPHLYHGSHTDQRRWQVNIICWRTRKGWFVLMLVFIFELWPGWCWW